MRFLDSRAGGDGHALVQAAHTHTLDFWSNVLTTEVAKALVKLPQGSFEDISKVATRGLLRY